MVRGRHCHTTLLLGGIPIQPLASSRATLLLGEFLFNPAFVHSILFHNIGLVLHCRSYRHNITSNWLEGAWASCWWGLSFLLIGGLADQWVDCLVQMSPFYIVLYGKHPFYIVLFVLDYIVLYERSPFYCFLLMGWVFWLRWVHSELCCMENVHFTLFYVIWETIMGAFLPTLQKRWSNQTTKPTINQLLFIEHNQTNYYSLNLWMRVTCFPGNFACRRHYYYYCYY